MHTSTMRKTVAAVLAVLTVAGCSGPADDVFGADLYSSSCAHCHGSDLAGGIGPPLGPGSNAATLTDTADHRRDPYRARGNDFVREPVHGGAARESGRLPAHRARVVASDARTNPLRRPDTQRGGCRRIDRAGRSGRAIAAGTGILGRARPAGALGYRGGETTVTVEGSPGRRPRRCRAGQHLRGRRRHGGQRPHRTVALRRIPR